MSPDPWNARSLAGLAAVAVLVGVLTAYCQHQEDDPVTTDPCVGAAYAISAAPAGRTPSSRKNVDRPSANLHKAPRTTPSVRKAPPRPSATAVVRPSKSTTPSHGGGHRHVDIDLDLEGC
ncbi:hypothetical protein ACFYSF_22830 [Streptomyces canus]|uniref:hypothetical protein n=1 Tax=Streptomyces canus TaxID=58343 RepID=UPI0036C5D563